MLTLANALIISAQILLIMAIIFAVIRIFLGPNAQDRVAALDAISVSGLILLLTIGIRTGSLFYVEAGLIMAVLGFASSAALAKFLMRGEVIE